MLQWSISNKIAPIGSPGRKGFKEAKRKRMKDVATRIISTWKVRSINQTGKIHNAIKEMKRMSIEIMGISEMRWPGSGHCRIGEHTYYYSGGDNCEKGELYTYKREHDSIDYKYQHNSGVRTNFRCR